MNNRSVPEPAGQEYDSKKWVTAQVDFQPSCTPYACQPPAGRLEQATYLPNDHVWIWTCEHGRTFARNDRWEPGFTIDDLADQLGLDKEKLRRVRA